MLVGLNKFLIHFVGAALACAQLAYWGLTLTTPPSAAAPAPARSMAIRDPDPALLARAFGQIERVAGPVAANIQLAGVYDAGRDSSAVFVVGDAPARAVWLGQEVTAGTKLVAVDSQSATLDTGGVRQQLRVPAAPVAGSLVAGSAAAAPAAGFQRHGNVLTAPTVEAPPTVRAGSPRAFGGRTQPGMPQRGDLPPGHRGAEMPAGTPPVQ
jgi:general secretion pathway protein C